MPPSVMPDDRCTNRSADNAAAAAQILPAADRTVPGRIAFYAPGRRTRGVAHRAFVVSSVALSVAIAACTSKAQDNSAQKTSAGAEGAQSMPGTQLAPRTLPAPPGAPTAIGADTVLDVKLVERADAGRLVGRDSGAMWLIVISDFQCPYCKQWHDSSFKAVKRDYVDKGKVRLGYLNFPLQQHPHARVEAIASMCAAAQRQFWPFADMLFAQQQRINTLSTIEPLLDSTAKALRMDLDQFASCRKSRAISALVESDIQQAVGAGVQSTPSFLIGEFLVQGVSPYADFRKAIDSALVVERLKTKEKG